MDPARLALGRLGIGFATAFLALLLAGRQGPEEAVGDDVAQDRKSVV
jgi:hypothetical protein